MRHSVKMEQSTGTAPTNTVNPERGLGIRTPAGVGSRGVPSALSGLTRARKRLMSPAHMTGAKYKIPSMVSCSGDCYVVVADLC